MQWLFPEIPRLPFEVDMVPEFLSEFIPHNIGAEAVRLAAQFSERFEGKADGILGRCEADVDTVDGNDPGILLVAVEAQQTADLFADAAQFKIGIQGCKFHLLYHQPIDLADAENDAHLNE